MSDAEVTLRKIIDTIVNEHKYVDPDIRITAITSGGANFTSTLYNVKICDAHRDELNLFAKVATVGDKIRGQMNADWMYMTEKYVYTKLAPLFKELQSANNVSEDSVFVFPKFYGSISEVGEESIVLENLVVKGFSPFNRLMSLSCNQVRSCMENLANYHALSFVYEKSNPDEYRMTLDTLRYKEIEQSEEGKELFRRMLDSALSVLDEDQKRRLEDLVKEAPQKFIYFNKPMKKPVLIHGDYKPSNLLYKQTKGKLELIAVDYQTVHAGCLAMDIMYFITVATDHHFRRLHFQDTLDHYYNHLADTLQKFRIHIGEVYPRCVFDEEIKEMLPFAIIIGLTVLPIVCVDEDHAPQVSGEADLNGFAVKPSRLFAERFRAIVNDCIQWGAI